MRGKGEGSLFKDENTGLWTGIIELPAMNGTRRRKTIRRKSKADLRDAMDDLRRQLKDNGDLPTKSQNVEQWFTYWLDKIAAENVRPNTLNNSYRPTIKNHIIPAIGHIKLDKLGAANLRRVYDHITIDKGLSSTTALLAHRIMSASFKIAVREGRLYRNPCDLIQPPRKASVQLDVLNLEEVNHLVDYMRRHNDPLFARWMMALLTGARRGEVIGLERDRVGDVLDLSWQLQRIVWQHGCKTPCKQKRANECPSRVLKVPADYEYRHLTGGLYLTRPKSSAGWRLIPLVEPLRSILLEHMDRTPENPWGLVFAQTAWPLDPDQDTRAWRTLLSASGIDKDVRLHDLRHTAVDLLYLAGVPEDVIQLIVGHSTRAQTRAYKSRGDLTRLVAGMNSLGGLLNPQPGSLETTPRAVEQ